MSDKEASTFRLCYSVKTEISASPAKVWGKLTDARGFSAWNSTVDRIEGDIALGKKLTITVPIAPGRKFTPTVKELVAEQRMVWSDGFYPMFQGTRTFTLTPKGPGTVFEMVEELRGIMLPMIKGSLPDFCPVFDRYAADLKKICEG
jgi:uncharacterized protein YndB with AHSA1/START domain